MDLFTTPRVKRESQGAFGLRDYQSKITDGINSLLLKGIQRIMCCSPTGSGKTVIFTHIAKEAMNERKRVLVLTHRKELLLQSGGTFSKFGVNAYNLTAESKIIPTEDIVVGMIETLFRRLENKDGYIDFLDSFDYVIIDEGHEGSFDKMFKYFNKQIVLAFSATPYRRNPKIPLNTFYKAMVQGPSVKSLTEAGWLSKGNVYGQRIDLSNVGMRSGEYKAEDLEAEFNAQGLYKSLIKECNKIIPNKKTLIFTPTVSSAVEVSRLFNEAKIPATYVEANTTEDDRRERFRKFNTGEYMVLANQGIATIGFDEPTIEAIVLFRATRSLVLYLQMIGRGTRVIEGIKDTFTILDFGNNTSRFGFYDDEREWSLENDTTTFKKETTMTKVCPNCSAIVPMGTVTCKCGHVWTKQRREQLIEEVEIELMPLKGWDVQEYAIGKSFEELEVIREIKDYKKSWIMHQLQTLDDLRQYGEYMKYKPGWFNYAKQSFKPQTLEQRKESYEAFLKNRNG